MGALCGSCFGCGEADPVREMSAANYLANEARTGDILLLSSDGDEARLVKTFTSSRFSHVAMVIVLDKPLSWTNSSGVYLWHAPSDHVTGLKDLMNDPPSYKGGPQLNDLRDALRIFRRIKSMEIRRLVAVEGSDHPWASGVVSENSPLMQHVMREHVKQYETKFMDLARAAIDNVPGFANSGDSSSLFCSELVALTLKEFRVMRTDLPADEFIPKDFGSSNDYALGLSPQFRLRHEIKIVS